MDYGDMEDKQRIMEDKQRGSAAVCSNQLE